MFAIDDPSAVAVMPTPEAAGTAGWWSEGNPALGQAATLMRASWFNGLQQELLNILSAAGITPNKTTYNQLLAALNLRTPIVGLARNLRALVSTAAASATFTADEVVVKAALGGIAFVLPSFNKTINLATTGAGGMDTGTAPVSGFVAIYAIYNPTTGASNLLATNATSAAQPNVYGGANMPAGYTASALISVVQTNASAQMLPFFQRDRRITVGSNLVLNSSAANTSTAALSVATYIPLNAKSVIGWATRTSNVATSGLFIGGDLTNGLGTQQIAVGSTSGTGYSGASWVVDMSVAQTIYWSVQNNVSTTVYVSGYEI